MSYEKTKNKLLITVNRFSLSDDLIYLATAEKLARKILESEQFPTKEYERKNR